MASEIPLVTVLGAGGFIGSRIVETLPKLGFRCEAPRRSETLAGRQLGHVVYCIGVTSDFRTRPLDTVEAHVCRLLDVLRSADWDTLIYLSSARLYRRAQNTSADTARFDVSPTDPDQLYDLTKLVGEALLHAEPRRAVAVRLSNVYGVDIAAQNFVCSLVRTAIERREVEMRSTADSVRDYISVDDVVRILAAILGRGHRRVYNLASGTLLSNAELLAELQRLTGCRVATLPGAVRLIEPLIDISQARDEFGFMPSRLLDDLPGLVAAYKAGLR